MLLLTIEFKNKILKKIRFKEKLPEFKVMVNLYISQINDTLSFTENYDKIIRTMTEMRHSYK